MKKATVAPLILLLTFAAAVQCQAQTPAPKSVAERLGYPANSRLLIIHADDFGMSHSDAYKKMLAPLPPGSYQLIVHLADNDDEMQGATADHPDWGAQWRQNDLDLVRSHEFQKFLKDQGFILLTWKDLAKALPSR